MFSRKEATTVAVEALRDHVGPGEAEEFRRTFEPFNSDLKPPPRGSLVDPIADVNYHGARVTRLAHVDSPEVLEALARAAQAGDRRSHDLLVEIARNPDGDGYGRKAAIGTHARYFPAEAGAAAASLMHESPINGGLGEALIRHTRTPELIPALEQIARHPDYVVRQGAMSALVELGEPGSEALARLLTSTNPEVRHTAADAIMGQKLATPAVLGAVQELSRRYPGDGVMVSQLREILGGSGFAWKFESVVVEALVRLDSLDRPDAAPSQPTGWSFGRVFSSRQTVEASRGPEEGLLKWHREREGAPLTKEERVAESLVKLAMLRPQFMFDLARASAEDLGADDTRGFGRVDLIEISRAEQRDSKVFVPLAKQLSESRGFRQRVLDILEAL